MALNVLIVDDSKVMRAMVLKTLHMSGIQISNGYEANNGKEGLEILSNNWIDLAIVDINMPVMNGEEMIEHMKANDETRGIPIIVISTEGSETRIARLLEKGISFIRKPFSPEIIRDKIGDIINIDANIAEEENYDDDGFKSL